MHRYWIGAALFLLRFDAICLRAIEFGRTHDQGDARARTCVSASTPAFGRIARRVRFPRSGLRMRRRTASSASSVPCSRRPMSSNAWQSTCRPSWPFYRAAQDFNGTDEFELEVTFSGGRKEIQSLSRERHRRKQRPGNLARTYRSSKAPNEFIAIPQCGVLEISRANTPEQISHRSAAPLAPRCVLGERTGESQRTRSRSVSSLSQESKLSTGTRQRGRCGRLSRGHLRGLRQMWPCP